ncbi:hypothetical protein ACIQVU_19890 [Lysinibacillus sp. NPDC098008]|uniref:hypothetical protein n=1 Tax=Lysinibacillus sp. NPDC098008 TaxID=3364146 RepID=UPI00382DFF89
MNDEKGWKKIEVISKPLFLWKRSLMLLLSLMLVISSALTVMGAPLNVQVLEENPVYVSLSGDDTISDGTEANPFQTIGKVIESINASGSSETLVLLSDITISGTLMFSGGQPITITSKEGQTWSLIRNEAFAGRLINFTSNSKVTLKNITIDGKSVKVSDSIIHIDGGSKVDLEDVSIQNHYKENRLGLTLSLFFCR